MLIKSCISKAEGQMIAFVVEINEKCGPKIASVKKFQSEQGGQVVKKKASTEEIDKMLMNSGIDPNTLAPIGSKPSVPQPPVPQAPQPPLQQAMQGLMPGMPSIPGIPGLPGTLPGVPDITTSTSLPAQGPLSSPSMPMSQVPQQPQRFLAKNEQIVPGVNAMPPLTPVEPLNLPSQHRIQTTQEDDHSMDQLKANMQALSGNKVASSVNAMFNLPQESQTPSVPSGPTFHRITNEGPNQPLPKFRASTLPPIANDFPRRVSESQDHKELVEVKKDMSDLKSQLASLTQLLQKKMGN